MGDFGLARYEDEDEYESYEYTAPKFAIKWTAPEAALMNRFSIKVGTCINYVTMIVGFLQLVCCCCIDAGLVV